MAEEQNYSASEGGDPTAASLALPGASREAADAYLRDQRHHLHEQFKRLRMGVFSDRLSMTLKFLTIIVGLAVAGGFGLLVWDAAHSKGLTIEPFSVPPDLATRGLTGEVIASQMIDKLTHMTKSESSRSVQSYANNWGNNIKVEIPETGVSIGELQRFLKDWLGHDIRISGEVYQTDTGIAVTARTSGEEGATFAGRPADLDALIQQAAEHVYEVTQPYRYANYLDRNYDPQGLEQRVAKATAIYRRLIAGDDALERAWAWNGLGTIQFRYYNNSRLSADYYRRALAEVPDFTIGYFALAARDAPLGREEEELASISEAGRLLHRDSIPDLNPHYVTYARLNADAIFDGLVGDCAGAVPLSRKGAELPDDFSVLARAAFIAGGMSAMAACHDLKAVRAWARELGWTQIRVGRARLAADAEAGDWRDILVLEAMSRKGLVGVTDSLAVQNVYDVYRPNFAVALARLGNFAAAEAMVAPVPADNDPGVRARALIAELQGQHARADWWFERSEKQTPSLPLTDFQWGQALLARGKPDEAIVKFTLASRKGPHFADPLEFWGEALMAQRNPDAALEKFAEAEKYAPNWGRLHLKWGEARAATGKREDAEAQFAGAARLDLTPSEKSELAKVDRG